MGSKGVTGLRAADPCKEMLSFGELDLQSTPTTIHGRSEEMVRRAVIVMMGMGTHRDPTVVHATGHSEWRIRRWRPPSPLLSLFSCTSGACYFCTISPFPSASYILPFEDQRERQHPIKKELEEIPSTDDGTMYLEASQDYTNRVVILSC